MKFSIVIPLYNEELNIENILNEIFLTLNGLYYIYEIVFIDDASTDNTLDVINQLKNYKNIDISVLKNPSNMGQSLSLVRGIKSSKYKTIVSIDGDGQNNPKDSLKLIKVYQFEKDIYLVGGLRLDRSDTFIKKYSSKIANFVRMSILKDGCKDTGCSLKVFDKFIFLEFPIFDGMHRFLPALFKGFNKKTKFIAVDHRKRIYGKSKYGTIDRLFRGIKDMYKVKKIIKNNLKNK